MSNVKQTQVGILAWFVHPTVSGLDRHIVNFARAASFARDNNSRREENTFRA